MARLESAVTALLTNLNRASDNLNAVMDEDNRRAVRKTLAELEVLTRTLAARSAAIDPACEHGPDHGKRRALHRRTAAARAAGRTERRRIRSMTDQIGGAGTSASGTLDSTRADLQRFTGETLPEDARARRRIAGRDRDAAARQRKVERNPSVLLFGKPSSKRGPGE